MDVFRFWKNKVIFFAIVTAIGYAFFNSSDIAIARDNAYLACFVDDNSYMFKTQVVYSSQEVERARLIILTDGDKNGGSLDDNYANGDSSANTIQGYSKDPIEFLQMKSATDRMNLIGNDGTFLHIPSSYLGIGDTAYVTKFKLEKGYPTLGIASVTKKQAETTDPNTGKNKTISMSATTDVSDGVDSSDVSWSKFGGDDAENENYVIPLTFPAATSVSSKNSDINRAYEVQDAISDDFKNALLYINGGKPYEDLQTLFETAYYLVTSTDTGITKITNPDGKVYAIQHQGVDQDNPYLYKIKIWELDSNKDNATYYNFKVKKGYLDCVYGDETEAGTTNTVATSKVKKKVEDHDTAWISWEHLYIEAAVLYAEGVTYSNQADLYTTDELENGIVKICRSLLNGLNGIMQFYSLEELIFNQGIRGGRAFVYGSYYENWSTYLTTLFLIFMSIALSMVTFIFIHIITKKQLATISPTMRVSLLNDIGRMIISLAVLASIWWVAKFLLICNFKFVEVWSGFVEGKTLESVGGSYSVLATIIFQFAYFIINTYVNFLYIMRSLFIAALIMLSPLFIIASAFGNIGTQITKKWAGALVGYIIVQSIHSFVYGFVIVASPGLRGIESVVVCSSIIPLTGLIKDTFGMDFKHAEKSAGTITATGAAAGAGAVMAGSAIAAKGTEVAGGLVGATAGGIAGRVTSARSLNDTLERIEAQRLGEQARLGSQNGRRVMPGNAFAAQQYGINARYEQQRVNAINRSNAQVRSSISDGWKVGSGAGSMVGGSIQAGGGLGNVALGLGYTVGTRESSPIAQQGFRDVSVGVGRSLDGFGDSASVIYSTAIQRREHERNRESAPPIMAPLPN